MEQYWGIIVAIVGVAVFAIFNRQLALSIAKTKAHQLILFVEKKAEEFALANGEAKKQWVIERGYAWLPKYFKLFVSADLFAQIVQYVYDEAMKYAHEHLS